MTKSPGNCLKEVHGLLAAAGGDIALMIERRKMSRSVLGATADTVERAAEELRELVGSLKGGS